MGKSAQKKLERMQEQMAQKFNVPKENPLSLPWVFEKWIEKLILIALMILGIWKLGGLIFGIF